MSFFVNGFDTAGEDAAWATTADAGSSVDLDAVDQVHAGVESCKCSVAAGGDKIAYAARTLGTSRTEIYCRAYFRWDTLPSTTRFNFFSIRSSGTWLTLACVSTNGRWELRYLNSAGAEATTEHGSEGPSTNTWYCVELYHYESTGSDDGVARLYIDGTMKLENTNCDNDAYGDVTEVRVGEGWGDGTIAYNVWVDTCEFDTSRVGCISAGISIPVAMHHYGHHIGKIIRG